MGSSQTIEDRSCKCMNTVQCDQWIICEKCFNWFHPICVLLSNEEFQNIMNKNEQWFCDQCEVSKHVDIGTVNIEPPNDSKKETNTEAPFRCECGFTAKNARGLKIHRNIHKKAKKKIVSQPEHKVANIVQNMHISENVNLHDLSESLLLVDEDRDIRTSERVVCNCGFIAKNNFGLKIHWGKQKKSTQLKESNLRSMEQASKSIPVETVDLKQFLIDFGLLLNKCQRLIPVTRIIQKSVRIIVCQELTNVINNVISNNDVASWMRLLAFPYLVLNSTKKKNNTGKNHIRLNLALFKNTVDINDALTTIIRDYGCSHNEKSINSEELVIKTANRKVGEGDIRGAIRVLCSNERIADPSPETKSKLKSKHPDDDEVKEVFTLEHELISTQVEDIIEAIRGFPLSSSGGVDGLRPRHLKDLTSFTCGESATHLLKVLATFTDMIKAGKIIQDIQQIFYGASLIAFDKKKIDIRPIAVGIVWRRLSGLSGLERMLSSKTECVKLMSDRLKLLDVHPALCIFKSSLSAPRFNYLLRSCKTFMVPNLLENVDEMFRSTLEVITNTKLNVTSWRQASLPLSFGGLRIRKATELAFPAYLSSVHQSATLANEILEKFGLNILDNEISTIISNLPPDFVPKDVESKKIQKKWDLLRMEEIFNDLLTSSEPVERARLLASSSKESSKWLQVVPSSQLGLLLDNNTARIAVELRLGCQICEEHTCVCGKLVDKNGRHGLSCNSCKGWIPRHNNINNICSHAISSAGVPNILQPPGISRSDGKRPDGMTLTPWSRGKSLLWDVTVRDTLANSYINISSMNAGAAADLAERRKHNHYIKLKEHHLFTPIAFESLGSCGPETREFLADLGKRLRKTTGEARSLDYLYQKISIAIQRGNAACIFGTFGNKSCDDFYLL